MECNGAMGEWKECQLGNVLTFQRGFDLPHSKMAEGPYPVMGSNGIIGWHNEYTTEAPSVTIGRSGSVGRPHLLTIPSWSHNTVLFVKDFKGNDPRFLYYFLFTLRLNEYGGGSAVPTLNRNVLHELKVCIPDLAAQRRIAAVLGALDDKIEVNRKICENLEAQAQALFKAWFVDFEPFGGKRPEGWKEVSLLDVVELFDMKRIPLSSREREKRKGQFPYYGATSIMDYVDDYLFDGVYLLMGEDGSVAREDGIPYLQYISGKFWVNNHAHIMQGRNGYSTEMLWCALSQTDISTFVTGAVQPKLSQTNMQMIKVPILAMGEMRRFGERVQPMFDMLRTKREESRALAAMRDALLPKLMSGELAVEKVEVADACASLTGQGASRTGQGASHTGQGVSRTGKELMVVENFKRSE